MTVFVCVDDGLGMAFNGRRQSRDKAVTEDLLSSCGGKLSMEEKSRTLFGETVPEASEDAFFMEFTCDAALLNKAERLVLYRWNRAYPSDVRFVMPAGFALESSREFPGSSHEKITREEYVREK